MSSIQARALLSPAGLLVAGGPAIRAASADLGGVVFGVNGLARAGDDAHLYATAYRGNSVSHFTVAGFTTATRPTGPDRPRPARPAPAAALRIRLLPRPASRSATPRPPSRCCTVTDTLANRSQCDESHSRRT